MQRLLAGALASALLLANHHSAQAVSITINSISGDANSFHGDFSWSWAAMSDSATISGSWAGGTFTFLTGVVGPLSDGTFDESFTTQTFWNDGWIPGGLQFFHNFDLGKTLSGPLGQVPGNYDPNAIAHDYSGLGLQYYLNSTATLNLTTALDTSGSERIIVDISRQSVPDASSTYSLLAISLLGLAFLRRKVC